MDMSPNGRYVVFMSEYSQGASQVFLDDEYLFLYDRNDQSYLQIASFVENPKVNNEGNIVFASDNSNLVANDNNDFTDVFLFIKNTSQIERISVNTNGDDANEESIYPDIAGSGTSTWIVFESEASDLIASDTNGAQDIFMFNWPNGQIFRISELSGIGGDHNSIRPRISKNTTAVSFLTYSDNLVGEDNPDLQVMAYDRVLNSLTLISRDHLGNIGEGLSSVAIPSATGRFIALNTESELLSSDINSHSRDVYVFDQQEQQMTILTQYNNGDSYESTSILNDFVVDNSQSLPLLGALFTNDSLLMNDYLNLNISSAFRHKQLYLMQSGGDGKELQLEVTGSGTVTGDSGFNCSDNCSQTYLLGQDITLIATPTAGASFLHWQGDVCDNSTELTCDVHLNDNKFIQAIFSVNDDVIFNNGFEN